MDYSPAVLSRFSEGYRLGRTQQTLCQVFNADAVELLDFFHDQLCLVDFYDDGSRACVPTSKSEFPEAGFDLIWNVDGMGLSQISQVSLNELSE